MEAAVCAVEPTASAISKLVVGTQREGRAQGGKGSQRSNGEGMPEVAAVSRFSTTPVFGGRQNSSSARTASRGAVHEPRYHGVPPPSSLDVWQKPPNPFQRPSTPRPRLFSRGPRATPPLHVEEQQEVFLDLDSLSEDPFGHVGMDNFDWANSEDLFGHAVAGNFDEVVEEPLGQAGMGSRATSWASARSSLSVIHETTDLPAPSANATSAPTQSTSASQHLEFLRAELIKAAKEL